MNMHVKNYPKGCLKSKLGYFCDIAPASKISQFKVSKIAHNEKTRNFINFNQSSGSSYNNFKTQLFLC